MRRLCRWRSLLLLGLLVAVTAAVWMPRQASAHATLLSSDPPANEIVSQSPGRVELTFSEGVEQTYTKVILVDQDNNPVAGTRLAYDEGNNRLVRLVIPDDLPRGTYSVVWRTLSADDGHRFSGYFAFTIGSTSDVRTVIPPAFSDNNGVPLWLAGVARWLSFGTLALLSGFWFAWLIVIRPGLSPVWQIGPDITRRVRRFALLSGMAYILAALFLLILQAKGQLEGGYLHTISAILSDTRWGRFWLMRIAFGIAVVLLIPITAWWWPRRRLWTAVPLLALSALLPLPFSMVAHASASTYGRSAAIAFDYLHLVAISLWAGGLATLLVAVTGAGDLLPRGRRLFLAASLPRFSWMALISFAAIGATGAYAGYLQVGTWSGLTDTDYGRQLLFKLAALAVVLIIASVNLLLVSRRIGSMSDGQAENWWRRFTGLVALEIVGAIIILFFAGRLTALEPSRAVLAQRENQKEVTFVLNGRAATLSVAPGSAGPNHFRLDVSGEALDPKVTASLLFVPPVDMAGDKAVTLDRTTGNAFEAHSAAMSVTGAWTITVTVSQVGAFQWSTDLTYPAAPRSVNVTSIGIPNWVFGPSAILGLLLALAGLFGIGWGLKATNRSARREGWGLGTVALLVAMLLIAKGRGDINAIGIPLNTPNPVPVSDQALTVGEAAYMANCISCHGVGGAGDGPAGINLVPPPANLLVGHAIYHADAEFFNWIRNGKPGTAMPAFSTTLSDDQIWSTILYVRSLQQKEAEAEASPAASPVASPIVLITPTP